MREPLDIAVDASGVVRLTLNRPKRANAVDPELAEALDQALEKYAADPQTRVLVLTGSGRTFTSGVDLGWMRGSGVANEKANFEDALTLARLLYRIHTLSVPTIAAVPG